MPDDYLIEEHDYKGYTIKIIADDVSESPREWDNLGTMVCLHGRYKLGDRHDFTPESIQHFAARPDVVALPLYLYDHSGISISTQSFIGRAQHAEWDSGQVGFIFVTHAELREAWGKPRTSNLDRLTALDVLKGEVETYDQFLRGEIYGYQVEDPDGEEVESCWGFYGTDYTEQVTECQGFVDNDIEEQKKREPVSDPLPCVQMNHFFNGPQIGYCTKCKCIAAYQAGKGLICPDCKSQDLSIFRWDEESRHPDDS